MGWDAGGYMFVGYINNQNNYCMGDGMEWDGMYGLYIMNMITYNNKKRQKNS